MKDTMITIRPFQPSDQDVIPEFVVNIQRGEFNVDVTIAGQPDLTDVAGFFRQGIGEFWVAVDDASAAAGGGRIVGTIGLKDIGKNGVALRKMFVAATHRGREHSIAQRLMDTLNLHCGKLGVDHVLLGTTAQMHAAHRFYERNGFARIAPENLPSHFLRMPVDNVFYERGLQSKHF